MSNLSKEQSNDHSNDTIVSDSEQIQIRREKLKQWRQDTNYTFPNQFKPNNHADKLIEAYGNADAEVLKEEPITVQVAGRAVLRRIMGKASFCHLQDGSGKIQVYVARDSLPEGVYAAFKKWDLGDILWVEGHLFKTKTGELTVWASKVELVTKALRPMPDKFHGLVNSELRARRRYVDLLANEASRQRFVARSKIIAIMRQFLMQRDFLEVETPMMQQIPGGASARPFVTHHNALDMTLYLRIAPELYLKRLLVGGFERVFEINRNFRNEGLSTRHNPEFTMLEYYQAYADYLDAMESCESVIATIVDGLSSEKILPYQNDNIDFSKPFARLTMLESIIEYNPTIKKEQLEDESMLRDLLTSMEIKCESNWGLGRLQAECFEATTEEKLIQPTFITQYPAEISPLARLNDDNPHFTDRFELFIAGREIANGFSELNDPEDQAERFKNQVAAKDAGDDEAMFYDDDYITALEYGMPPAAGVGIGVDRLVMLLTDSAAIREVILFPHLKPD